MQPDQLLEGLGRAVRERREERQLSQEELGLETGIHRNYIGGIERGERQPTVAALAKISNALGVSASQLIIRGEELAG